MWNSLKLCPLRWIGMSREWRETNKFYGERRWYEKIVTKNEWVDIDCREIWWVSEIK